MLIEDAERLAKIDLLYGLRLDQLVSLPVLAVVGDQSSGKSSVLEALTGLPFPRDSTLCTRFPTQIVFKRQQERGVNVSVKPAAGANEVEGIALREFAERWSQRDGSLEPEALVTILNETSQLLGLHTTNGNDQGHEVQRSFSNDLLKIEISGPEHDHFSVIDLPGLFRKPTEGQTTKADMLLVRDMVSSHLQNKRSIILAVVPANVDIATQEIIQMAEDADPGRERTLAVLTKPDLVDNGAESHVIDTVNQVDSSSGLGYVIVCNRSQRDLHTSLDERNANERLFFTKSPWKDIASDRAGVKALQTRLNNLSVQATRQSFDDVRKEIQKKLDTTRTHLSTLGQPRTSTESQRVYLLQLTSRYESLINKATDAQYGRDECFHQNPSMRLATVVMEESDCFSNTLAKRGFYRAFTRRDSSTDSESEGEATPVSATNDESEATIPESRSTIGFPELRSVLRLNEATPEQSPESITKWIARKRREFRGFEIGSTNPSLLTALVYEQTSSWHFYARSYLCSVIKRIHRCIQDILAHVCADEDVRRRLWKHILPKLIKTYHGALDHAEFLVNVERNGYPVTLNHYFAQTMLKRQRQRIEKSLKDLKAWHTKDESRQPLLRIDDILKTFVSNEEQNTEELGDILQSYHKVARKRFVDAVAKQAVDYMLICSKDGPLYVFSSELVGTLSEEDLQTLAGEDVRISDRRKQLQAEAQILEQGREILL